MSVRDIHSVLTTVTYEGWHLDRLKQIFAPAPVVQIAPGDAQAIARVLPTVDVAVLKADLDPSYASAPNLKWVHCDHAGVNKSARPEVVARTDLIVTASAGRAAPALAQHAFFFALALTYDAPALAAAKLRHEWRQIPGYSERRGLYGKTLGVIGLGYTGREVVALGKAMGMRVLGYGRGPEQAATPGLDGYTDAASGTIDTILAESDFVILCIRLTDVTYRMVGARELGLMKPSAYLINMARGQVVDEAALVAALHAGTIAGAGLDVFEQEPLPAGAAIWDAPNTIMTHHQTAEMPDLVARSLDIIAENVRRYRAGDDLLNRIKPEDVYTH
ncbi:MAG TPA: D-2-hydroxyacid dehydrogenase [Devosia sp.]|nr:D-2-hydroxyacid dehydrogenase [Devosia sp.]